MAHHDRLWRLACSATLTLTAACAATPGDDNADGNQEQAYEAKPKGPDNTPGSFTVVAPAAAPGTTLIPLTVSVAGVEHALGAPYLGLLPTTIALELKSGDTSSFGITKRSAGANVTILGSQANQLLLGGLALGLVGGPRTAGLDAIVHTRDTSRSAPDYPRGWYSSTEIVASNATANATLPVLPGRHLIRYGIFDGQVIDIAPGETVARDVHDYADRRMVRIVPPVRHLPDACDSGITLKGMASAGTTRMAIGLDAPTEVGENVAFLESLTNGPRTLYELPCVKNHHTLPMGEPGVAPKDFQLGRIDVADVDVTNADGTVTKVRGQWYLLDWSTRILSVGWLPTNTGLDLPPGTYELVVTYPQTAGTEGTFRETFTTP